MPADIDFLAESKKLIPTKAGCYDCDWATQVAPCRAAAEKHREENPTHLVWMVSTPTGTEITGAHDRMTLDASIE